jgi:hypothetical protein
MRYKKWERKNSGENIRKYNTFHKQYYFFSLSHLTKGKMVGKNRMKKRRGDWKPETKPPLWSFQKERYRMTSNRCVGPTNRIHSQIFHPTKVQSLIFCSNPEFGILGKINLPPKKSADMWEIFVIRFDAKQKNYKGNLLNRGEHLRKIFT